MAEAPDEEGFEAAADGAEEEWGCVGALPVTGEWLADGLVVWGIRFSRKQPLKWLADSNGQIQESQ